MQKISKLFPALGYRNYRNFWLTQWIALVGFWLQLTTQQWLVYRMTDSALMLGLLSAFQFLPSFLFTIPAGVWIDRHNKRKILMWTQCMYIIQASSLSLLLLSGHETYCWMLFFAFFTGSIDAFDMPTRLAFMQELVGPEALHSAMGLNSTNFNLTRMIGPVLAAFLLNHLSYSALFFMNAASLLPILFVYRNMDVNSVPAPVVNRNPFREMKSGFKMAAHIPAIITNIVCVGIISSFLLNFSTYGPLFSDRVLHRGLGGFGSLLFFIGFGSMIGGLLAASSSRKVSQKSIFNFAILSGILLMMVSYITIYALAMALFTFLGFMVILFMVNCNTAIQMSSPKEYLGRIMSLYTFVFLGCTPFGTLFTSAMIEYAGTSNGLFLIGALTVLLILLTIKTLWAGKTHTCT